MRLLFPFALSHGALLTLAFCLTASMPARAGKPDPAAFPLRVHILRNAVRPSRGREARHPSDSESYLDGVGAADLFENGNPQGFFYTYSCIGAFTASGGNGTYPARWKKKDSRLVILVPEAGKPWNLDTCELQTEMRPGLVFIWKNGVLAEEAAATLRDWMVRHRFDPENDRFDPVLAPGETPETTEQPLVGPD